jgi:DNA polymerase III subunit gamma/tau
MNSITLNLARKWRPKIFDHIIGQDLPVKMLKNSLYLNCYFPVYLFAGQKGCGKTTMARVFAAAINCRELPVFQQNPKQVTLPCMACDSCRAMHAGNHPDFIEIDAASNTGVDNIRQLVDAASLLPVMGNKKVYLIDEAHMLSKAAFNAFLKVLEEPPISVVFMLATTDTQKIIDTVRSRCFQLFFKPIELRILQEYLKQVCYDEHINFQEDGIAYIAQETGGCVRDALNLLEQVRFVHPVVTASAVSEVLGYLDDEHIITLYTLAITQKPTALLQEIARIKLEQFCAYYIWKRLVLLVRALIWCKFDAKPLEFINYHERLHELIATCSWQIITESAQMLYRQESIFLKTSAQHTLLEMMLLRIAGILGDTRGISSPTPTNYGVQEHKQRAPIVAHQRTTEKILDEKILEPVLPITAPEPLPASIVPYSSKLPWQSFVEAVGQLHDPLLSSIFAQGVYGTCDQATHVVEIEFAKELVFFQDWLDKTKTLWMPLLHTYFGDQATLQARFTGSKVKEVPEAIVPLPLPDKITYEKQPPLEKKTIPESYKQQPGMIDISDTQRFATTHLLLHHFPGIVREIKES